MAKSLSLSYVTLRSSPWASVLRAVKIVSVFDLGVGAVKRLFNLSPLVSLNLRNVLIDIFSIFFRI